MKIALINGSPRVENSSKIIDHITETFLGIDFKIINLGSLNLNYCNACGWCRNKEGHCVKNDDIDKAYETVVKCDGIIYITPVYFGGPTAQMKTFLDRTCSLRRNDFMLKNKISAVIATGATRNGGQELTIQSVHASLHINGMIVVGNDSHFGGTVHGAFEDDAFGKKTVNGTVNKVMEIIGKFK